MSLINTTIRQEARIARLQPYITFRNEPFGGLVFNPYLGVEEELDPQATYATGMIERGNAIGDITMALQSKFGIDVKAADICLGQVIELLKRMYALNLTDEINTDRPRLHDSPDFGSDPPPYILPKSVIWEVTYRCNMRCPHCLTASGDPISGELDTQQALELINGLARDKILYLSLSGGEPFVRPDILTLLQAISQTNMRLDVATNGLMIPDEVYASLEELDLFQVQVSIDGIGEAHDSFRGVAGSYTKALHTVKKLRECGVSVSLGTTVTPGNVDYLDDLIDLALSLGCSGYKAIPFISAGRGHNFADRLTLNSAQHEKFCRVIERRSQELEGCLRVVTETSYSFLLKPPPKGYRAGKMGCSAGHDLLTIGADGTVYPCPFFHDLPVGKWDGSSLMGVWWNNPVLNRLRRFNLSDMAQSCQDCEYATILCRGGCRAAAYMSTGDLAGKDPTCFKKYSHPPGILKESAIFENCNAEVEPEMEGVSL
ncbi:MAG: radical SAM protein [Candidatus Sabulitectum sp.]|nr:radical SAM protein [Candidatus Sabulitectum sp.]